jgi:hypothetical protein
VLLDLRPITELLAPPFFDDYEMTVTARRKLTGDLMNYLAGKEPPRAVDVFHYLSLSFLQPQGEVWDAEGPVVARPGENWVFRSHSPAEVRVSGSSHFHEHESALLKLPPFIGEQGMLLKQIFCYSGNKTDHQIFMRFTLPTGTFEASGWSFGGAHPGQEPCPIELNFALDDERLLKEGVAGTFVLATELSFNWGAAHARIKFPVVLKRLNLRDAFFNGLPVEWKENLKSLKQLS